MKFVAFYRNNKENRDQVIALLMSAIQQGYKLDEGNITHELFFTQKVWPKTEIIERLPLFCQIEEIEYIEGSLRTIRQNVIDVETISVERVDEAIEDNPVCAGG